MSQLLLQVLSILTEPSGDLIFHLVQIFSALAALLLALSSHQDNKSTLYRRFLLGIIVVLASQLALFLITTFGWRGYFDTHLILPILDRTVNSLCMVWIIWLWVAPQPWKIADYALIGLNILIGVLFLTTGSTWIIQGSAWDFNSTWQDLIWINFMVLTIVAGLIGLIHKKPDGWGVGVGFLAINLTGLTAHLVYPMQPGDYVGIVRLVQVFTYPLLPVLTRRFTALPAPVSSPAPLNIPSGPPERTRFTAEARTIDTWLQLSAQERSVPFQKFLVKAIAQTMVADICLLVSTPDSGNQVRINSGYDLIRQETFSGGIIKGENIPEIIRAFKQNLPIIMLTGGSVSRDLKAFRDVLNLKAPSNSMFIPILYHQVPIAGMLLCSPYSTRVWDITDESYLYSVTNRVGALLAEITKKEENLESSDLINLDEEGIRQKYSLLKEENIALVTEIDVLQHAPELPPEIPPPLPEPPMVIALPAVTATSSNNHLGMSYEEEENLRTELRIALEEVSRLKTTQAVVSDQEGSEENVKSDKGTNVESLQFEIIRKSLEDIYHQVENLAENQPVQGTSTGPGSPALIEARLQVINDLMVLLENPNPILEPIQFLQAVDTAIHDNNSLLAKSDISLLTDIPETLPAIKATSVLIRSITSRILRNIITISPSSSVINLQAIIQDENLLVRINHNIDPSLPDESKKPLGQDLTFPAPAKGFSDQEWYLLTRQMAALQGEIFFSEITPQEETIVVIFKTSN